MKKSTLNFKRDKKFKKRLVEFNVPVKKSNELKRTQSLPSNVILGPIEPDPSKQSRSDRIGSLAKPSVFNRNSKALLGSISGVSAKSQSTATIANKPRAWSSSPQNSKYIKRPLPNMNNFVPVLPKKVISQLTAVMSRASFVGFTRINVHEHNHMNRPLPHMHKGVECDRYMSGFDRNRESRFYFTSKPTPVRVYLKYNEKLALAQADKEDSFTVNFAQLNPTLHGRKLSPRTLRQQLKISTKFLEDAKNLIFVRDTLSLIPQLTTQTNSTTALQSDFLPPLTYAEMALMGNTHVHNAGQGQTKHVKQPAKKTHKSPSVSSHHGSTHALSTTPNSLSRLSQHSSVHEGDSD